MGARCIYQKLTIVNYFNELVRGELLNHVRVLTKTKQSRTFGTVLFHLYETSSRFFKKTVSSTTFVVTLTL